MYTYSVHMFCNDDNDIYEVPVSANKIITENSKSERARARVIEMELEKSRRKIHRKIGHREKEKDRMRWEIRIANGIKQYEVRKVWKAKAKHKHMHSKRAS